MTDTPRCLLCGHEGHEDDGVHDPTTGEWYCEVCTKNAPSGEVPLHGY